LLFFYSHVLKKEFGEFRNIPRAKRTKYVLQLDACMLILELYEGGLFSFFNWYRENQITD
jgi:hypothetical protein